MVLLKYNIGDKVKVNNNLNINSEDDTQERLLIGQISTSITAAFPYELEFINKKIQQINWNMGSRLFDEYELDRS